MKKNEKEMSPRKKRLLGFSVNLNNWAYIPSGIILVISLLMMMVCAAYRIRVHSEFSLILILIDLSLLAISLALFVYLDRMRFTLLRKYGPSIEDINKKIEEDRKNRSSS